jgi:hypothetical protein
MGCRIQSGLCEDLRTWWEEAVMTDEEEPGSDKVTASTRAFEEIDAQVFPGPGRGATRLEAAASERWGGPAPATVDAYRRMIALVAKHELAHGDPMKQDGRKRPTAPVAQIGSRGATPAQRWTKPRSSPGADLPDVSRHRQSRLPRKANT